MSHHSHLPHTTDTPTVHSRVFLPYGPQVSMRFPCRGHRVNRSIHPAAYVSFLERHIPAVEQQRCADPGYRAGLYGEAILVLCLHTPDCLHWQQGWGYRVTVLPQHGAPRRRRGHYIGKEPHARCWSARIAHLLPSRWNHAAFVCTWTPIQQTVLDPANARPVLACVAVAGALLALLYTAKANKLRDEREKRRRLYCKSGSFGKDMPLPNVPKDVCQSSLSNCAGQAPLYNLEMAQTRSLCPTPCHAPLCQIRVERTSDRDLVLFAEDVFLSIEGHGVSASDSARLLRGRQAPRGSMSGTQQPHMRRFSMSRVAPSVRSAGSCMPPRYPQSPSHRCDCCLQWLGWHMLSGGRHDVRRNACWHGLRQSTRRQRAQR